MTAPSAVAQPAVLTIGVDNATPAPCASAPVGTRPPQCHNFEYTSYYPNGFTTGQDIPINVHQGDVVGFVYNQGSPDGFHTATLLVPGESQATAFGKFPLESADSDNGAKAGQQQLNPAVLYPSNPAC